MLPDSRDQLMVEKRGEIVSCTRQRSDRFDGMYVESASWYKFDEDNGDSDNAWKDGRMDGRMERKGMGLRWPCFRPMPAC